MRVSAYILMKVVVWSIGYLSESWGAKIAKMRLGREWMRVLWMKFERRKMLSRLYTSVTPLIEASFLMSDALEAESSPSARPDGRKA